MNDVMVIFVSISITGTIYTAIREYEKGRRIEKLKGLKDSKIDSIGNDEKKSNFWNRFSN